jgi:hypothetical protein
MMNFTSLDVLPIWKFFGKNGVVSMFRMSLMKKYDNFK